MKNKILTQNIVICFVVLIIGGISCSKDADDTNVSSSEPISFITPDSTIIWAEPGQTINFSLQLTTDRTIDTLRGGYLIDTVNMSNNLTLSDMDSVFLVTGFTTTSNIQSYSGQFIIPDSIPNVRSFHLSNTFGQDGDKIRLLFRMEAQGKIAEKQLKIILTDL